jgi:DNA-binding transcriptional ArsR family regulator
MALEIGPLLDALGDQTRRKVFERLGRGPTSVKELAAGLPVSRPAVSQHLKVLKEAGLVLDRAEGTRRIYQANPAALRAIHAYLDRCFDRAQEVLAEAAEREGRRRRPVVTPDLDAID